MPGHETLNAGSGPPSFTNPTGALRSDNTANQPTSTPGTTPDKALQQQSRNKLANGDAQGAAATAANIKDPAIRQQTNSEIANNSMAQGPQDPPPALMQDGAGGLSDPLALFFMMVFYLKEATPTFSWKDVLSTAKDLSNQNFENIVPDAAFLPQRSFQDSGTATAGTGAKGQLESQQRANEEALKKQQDANQKKLTAQHDADSKAVSAKYGSSAGGKGGNAGPVVVWPIQNMPIIGGGLNKSVDWPNNQVATLAEPTIALNKGASAIEIDIEFTYAVGVVGVGDGEVTAATGAVDPTTGQPANDANVPNPPDPGWSVEEIMGMMYLATSLIYPFESSPVVASAGDKTTPPDGDKRTSAQFPVVFLRHYSLFPFLTPFVVKSVKIEPDENQPLIITSPTNLNKGFQTHLTYPAVRQVVKITLSLMSAHYYLPIFGGKDQDNQIQKQTSGSTYLQLSKSLLTSRIP